MQQTPTTWQYLLDLVTKSKLKAASESKDPAFRARQEKYYTDLKESECAFSKPVRKGDLWYVTITCRGRGFQLQDLPYKTGTLFPMVKPMANYVMEPSSVAVNTMTGLYYVMSNEHLHLQVHPQSNLWEALKMTGYEFSPSQFTTTMFEGRNEELAADGFIDIKDTVVSGRIYVSYLQKRAEKVEDPKPPVADPVIPPVETGVEGEGTAPKLDGGVDEFKEPEGETQPEAPVEEKAEEKQQPQNQQNQQNKNQQQNQKRK
ncbi:hypothetical protein YUBABA_01160 [Serratia phage vB_SmaM-Yubaba]|nr:hypothetical protein YUBABA_01160 [Serratia phage vB_SmaM-Yubaba]